MPPLTLHHCEVLRQHCVSLVNSVAASKDQSQPQSTTQSLHCDPAPQISFWPYILLALHLLQLKCSQGPALLSPDAATVTVPTG